MKKYLVILCLFLFTCGCGKSGSENIINKFKAKINDSKSYLLKGSMDIVSNEDTFSYNIESSKSKDDYYKVSLINKNNDHEQVILKNKDGVYVVTPDLNKSFKFQSDWPNNGSQSYLLDVLVNDISNDNKAYVGKEDKFSYIQCRVNYPNNNTLYSEKIYLDENYDVKKVLVLDKDGNIKITLNVSSIDYKPKFNDEYFSLENLIMLPEDNNSNEEKEENIDEVKDNENIKNTSNLLDEIIYPLYIPQNTSLSTQDTINTDSGNRAILTFAGEKPFVLVEEVSRRFDELEIIPVNGEPLIMSDCVGALSSNSLYWTSNGVDYYLSSTSLDGEELMTIAEGLTGTSVIVSGEK